MFRGKVSVPGTHQAKPRGYPDRRAWQDAARDRGEIPECGRAACTTPADPAWVNAGSPLLYCRECAALINSFTPGLCAPEVLLCTCCAEHPAECRAYANAAAERDGGDPVPVCGLCAPLNPDRRLPLNYARQPRA